MVGTLQTGDHVDVYAGLQTQSNLGQNAPVLRLLMANVPVLKVPSAQQSGGIGGPQTTTTSLVTLGVDSNQAGPLAYATATTFQGTRTSARSMTTGCASTAFTSCFSLSCKLAKSYTLGNSFE